jgi:hypothetical protein
MQETQSRPELKIYGANITFEFTHTGNRPADRVYGESASAALLTGILLAAAGVLATAGMAAPMPSLPEVQPLTLGAAAVFLLLAIMAGMHGVNRFLRRRQEIDAALDGLVTELSVEDTRLVRLFASGRAESGTRDEIHDVLIERRREYFSAEGEQARVNSFAVLCVELARGGRIGLVGPVPGGAEQEQDLHWMAGELRQALRVPHGDPPSPVDEVKLVRGDDGITIEVPHRAPAQVWRADVTGLTVSGCCLCGFLYGSAGIVMTTTWHDKGLANMDWTPVTILCIVASSFAALFAIGLLVQLIGRSWLLADIADKTAAWVGVRGDRLFRRYLSGREETWPRTDIAAVCRDSVGQLLQVRMHFKQGAIVHLYGELAANGSQPRDQEALAWIADRLSAALPRPEPASTPIASSSAIIDLDQSRGKAGEFRE